MGCINHLGKKLFVPFFIKFLRVHHLARFLHHLGSSEVSHNCGRLILSLSSSSCNSIKDALVSLVYLVWWRTQGATQLWRLLHSDSYCQYTSTPHLTHSSFSIVLILVPLESSLENRIFDNFP